MITTCFCFLSGVMNVTYLFFCSHCYPGVIHGRWRYDPECYILSGSDKFGDLNFNEHSGSFFNPLIFNMIIGEYNFLQQWHHFCESHLGMTLKKELR